MWKHYAESQDLGGGWVADIQWLNTGGKRPQCVILGYMAINERAGYSVISLDGRTSVTPHLPPSCPALDCLPTQLAAWKNGRGTDMAIDEMDKLNRAEARWKQADSIDDTNNDSPDADWRDDEGPIADDEA